MNYKKLVYYIPVLFFILNISTYAQADLRRYTDFFQQQKQEYALWLQKTNINQLATLKEISVSPGKIVLLLQSNFSTDDSLRVAWKKIQQQYNKSHNERIGEKMFDVFTFLFDIGLDSAIIKIQGNEFENSFIKIYYNKYVREDENFPNILLGGTIDFNFKDINIQKLGKLSIKSKTETVFQLRKAVSKFIYNYYKDKGSFFYKAYVDTSRTYYNKFIYRITCLKDEIISDGYFEYIQFKVEVMVKEKHLEIRYDILAKYASGIRCPGQRDKFYKSMETHYPDAFKQYKDDLHLKIESFIRGY